MAEYKEELKPVYIYVPTKNQIIGIKEGSGDNLSKEDRENGYVDYIYYSQYELGEDIEEVDGGDILQKEYLRDKYKSLEEVIPEVLEFVYDISDYEYIVIKPTACDMN